jgi:hypothetical protein
MVTCAVWVRIHLLAYIVAIPRHNNSSIILRTQQCWGFDTLDQLAANFPLPLGIQADEPRHGPKITAPVANRLIN